VVHLVAVAVLPLLLFARAREVRADPAVVERDRRQVAELEDSVATVLVFPETEQPKRRDRRHDFQIRVERFVESAAIRRELVARAFSDLERENRALSLRP
jgi:hypothetical protein